MILSYKKLFKQALITIIFNNYKKKTMRIYKKQLNIATNINEIINNWFCFILNIIVNKFPFKTIYYFYFLLSSLR